MIFLVLPAFNEADNIVSLLKRVQEWHSTRHEELTVVLVDDGSEDNTTKIAQEAIEIAGGDVQFVSLVHPVNLGLGKTVRDGLQYSSDNASPEDVIVVMDADDSHDPRFITPMLDRLAKGYDVIIASRFRRQSQVCGLSIERQCLSLGALVLFRFFYPINGVRDYTCGFRLYRASTLQKAFTVYDKKFIDQEGFQCMVDILLKLNYIKAKFAEVPFTLHYDRKVSISKMKAGKTILATLLLLATHRLSRN